MPPARGSASSRSSGSSARSAKRDLAGDAVAPEQARGADRRRAPTPAAACSGRRRRRAGDRARWTASARGRRALPRPDRGGCIPTVTEARRLRQLRRSSVRPSRALTRTLLRHAPVREDEVVLVAVAEGLATRLKSAPAPEGMRASEPSPRGRRRAAVLGRVRSAARRACGPCARGEEEGLVGEVLRQPGRRAPRGWRGAWRCREASRAAIAGSPQLPIAGDAPPLQRSARAAGEAARRRGSG